MRMVPVKSLTALDGFSNSWFWKLISRKLLALSLSPNHLRSVTPAMDCSEGACPAFGLSRSHLMGGDSDRTSKVHA
ncbi:O-fucosyltransferase family protein [Psidium guajava]|nr:O-fucosyltransferase family protein [Psidium guajava]